jgi:hypothetical protein
MPIHKTIENPASYRVTVDVPREMPVGPIILTFTPAASLDQRSVAGTPEPVDPWSNRQSCRTMEEALAAAERRREAAKTDPSVYSLKPWHGILEHSKAWGKHVDVAAEIRKMRDEWPDYWGTDGNT